MTKAEIEARVKSLVTKVFGVPEDQVSLSDKIREVYSEYWLDEVEFVMELESEFGLEIEEDPSRCFTVGEYVSLITSLLNIN